jgi:hypothetical protein
LNTPNLVEINFAQGFSMAPFPHWVTIVFGVIAMLGTLTTLSGRIPGQSGERPIKVADDQSPPPVVGYDVQNSGPGVGQQIINNGTGTGGEVTVTVPPGTPAIGTRVIQTGPGIGLSVINNGQGVGFRSTVTVAPR